MLTTETPQKFLSPGFSIINEARGNYLAFSLCCWSRSRSCQMNRVPGLLLSSRVGLEGTTGDEEEEFPSIWGLDLKDKV